MGSCDSEDFLIFLLFVFGVISAATAVYYRMRLNRVLASSYAAGIHAYNATSTTAYSNPNNHLSTGSSYNAGTALAYKGAYNQAAPPAYNTRSMYNATSAYRTGPAYHLDTAHAHAGSSGVSANVHYPSASKGYPTDHPTAVSYRY